MTRIVFLDRATLPATTVLTAPPPPAELICHEHTAAGEVMARITGAEVVITNKVALTAEVLSGATELRHIAVAATGYDMIDLDVCRARGITVSNIRDYAGETVPEHTFALILALQRSIIPYRQSVIDGRWEEAGAFCYHDFPIQNLAGKRLGIIGDGALGQRVAALGAAFGMQPVFSAYEGCEDRRIAALMHEDDSEVGYADLDVVLRTSDVITLHCPLLPSTRHILSREAFARMERRPLLINTARGGLVDEAALEEALEAGLIRGAGFDVVTTEPPGAGHIMHRIARRQNVIITPHVAWAAEEAMQALADQLMENVRCFLAGRTRNLVA
jgi:glycerate dehydrogenase